MDTGRTSPRTADAPQGGVVDMQNPEEVESLSPKSSGVKTTRTRVRTKIDLMSMKQVARWANKTNEPMFLCVLRANSQPDDKNKRRKAKAGAAEGSTEGERRRTFRQPKPVTQEVPVE